ncbi:MAG: glycosyltransferase family 4 protein [Bacillota bacterium]
MAKLKILQVITLSETGGAQKVLYHLAAGLSPAVFDVTVACAPGGELVRWLRELGWVRVVEVPHLRREISPLRDMAAFFALYRLMQRERFDVVHCHSSKAGIIGRLAAYLAGVRKIIFTVHGWGITPEQGRLERFFYTWAERLAGLLSTDVVCVSEADRERGLKEKLAPAAKLKVICNGVPAPPAARGDGEDILRAELGLAETDLVVGTVCRLCRQKNPLFFLEVARNLLSASRLRDNLYFVLIGDGPLKRQCEDYIKQHHLRDRVFLAGSREDAACLMAGFDVFCLFSLWEGLPLTVIEAMHGAVPVVAAGVGGVPELVIEGETGFFAPPGDVEKAARIVEGLLAEPDLRRRLGQAGRRLAREKFSLEKMVDRYRSLYLSGTF